MGHPSALLDRVGEPQAPGDREAAAVAGALQVPRPAHGGGAGELCAQRPDRRRMAHAREAHVLLRRMRADSEFQGESTYPGSPRQIVAILKDVGAELPHEEVPRRFAVRQRPLRTSDGGEGGRSGDLQRGI